MLRSPVWYMVILSCGVLFAGLSSASERNTKREALNQTQRYDAAQGESSQDVRTNAPSASSSWRAQGLETRPHDPSNPGQSDSGDTPSDADQPIASGSVAGFDVTIILNESEPNNVIDDAQELSEVFPSTDTSYGVLSTISPNQDVDVFEIFAVKGAIYGFAALGGGAPDTIITLYDAEGQVLAINDDHEDIADQFPADSPFIGGNSDLDSAIIWVAPESGSYFVEVKSFQSGSGGEYQFNVRARLPKLRNGPASDFQTFVLDFNGADINASEIFGSGPTSAVLSPFSDFLISWFPQFDENNPPNEAFRNQVIDAVVETVRENLDDLRKQSLNGDRDDDGILGNFAYELFVVREPGDTDIFGGRNISRIVIGGTEAELGLSGIAFSPGIDPGNYATEETGVVLLDRLSQPAPAVESINSIVLGGSASTTDAIGQVVGNLASKIIGQMVGNLATDGDNDIACVMDEGGTGATLMTFDEVAPGNVNNTVIGDSTLNYTPANGENATIGAGLFQASALIAPPYVEGSIDGTLTVSFSAPVTGVGYRFAVKNSATPENPIGPLDNVSTIELLDSGNNVVATATSGIAVSQFGVGEGANLAVVSGAASVTSARITFDGSIDADTFAVDTLTTFATASFVSRNLAGTGEDNILGTADDADPDFVEDEYLPAASLASGKQRTDALTAFGLSSGTEPLPVCTSIFFDETFENATVFEDLEDFDPNNNVGPGNGQWRLTDACDSLLTGHSQTTSMYFGVDDNDQCSYDVGNSDGWVEATVGEVSGEVDVSFNYFLESEGDLLNFDIATFEVAPDGVNFELYATNQSNLSPFVLSDPSGGWINLLVDGICPNGFCSNLVLRWRFTTGDNSNNDFRGFYVDDVTVCEHVDCAPIPPGSPTPKNLATDQPTENLILSWNGQASGGGNIDGITFDEVDLDTNINNTLIDIVRFEFAPGDALVVAGNEFFDSNFLFPPFVRGPIAGDVTLRFSAPVGAVGFSFGFPDGSAVEEAATITLFDGNGMPISTQSADLQKSSFTIAEGELFTDSDIPISSATISFSNPEADVFFLDNIRYTPLIESGPSSGSTGGVASQYFIPREADKISPMIKRNQRRKADILSKKPTANRNDLIVAGIGGESFNAEECAVYVHQPLSDEEITEMAAQGIEINSWAWVPPVQGRHPFGFYLAKVNYESMGIAQADPRIVRLSSVERMLSPTVDLSATLVGADDLKAGFVAGQMYTGAGVRVAVADSGLDLSHPDFPEPVEAFDVTIGTSPLVWDTDVSNKVNSHGTHVTGTVLGSGELSDGQYAGAAPDADLYFYKIGNDINSNASTGDIIEAVNRASEVGCHIFNMSYGGFGGFMDGSDPAEQAIDAATESGMISFISAGNDGNLFNHLSRSAPPDEITDIGQAQVFNFSVEDPLMLQGTVYFFWNDGTPGDNNLEFIVERTSDKDPQATIICDYLGASPRGTESMICDVIIDEIPPESEGLEYNIKIINNDDGEGFPLVHLYFFGGFDEDGFVFFPFGDNRYQVGTPAVADTAMAVGAWVHREFWINANGDALTFGEFPDTLATFSSRGPRIDGAQKPDIVSPGSATIATRDLGFLLEPDPVELWIDDDGLVNPNNDDDSNYLVLQGTSMASPYAAGSAALLKEANPLWSPERMRLALTTTADRAQSPNNDVGFGLINLPSALQTNCGVTYDVYWGPADSTPIKICSGISQNFCPAPPMDFGVDYEWFVVENRPVGSIAGQGWTYSTGCILQASIPANCDYETGQPHTPDDANAREGRDQVILLLDTANLNLRPSDFSVTDETGNAPSVDSIQQNGATVTLNLTGPLSPGVWSIIALGGCETAIGFFPGEINDDGVTDAGDVRSLIDVLDGDATNASRSDLDRDGSVGPEDLLRLIDLINGGGEYEVYGGAITPECPLLEEEEE